MDNDNFPKKIFQYKVIGFRNMECPSNQWIRFFKFAMGCRVVLKVETDVLESWGPHVGKRWYIINTYYWIHCFKWLL